MYLQATYTIQDSETEGRVVHTVDVFDVEEDVITYTIKTEPVTQPASPTWPFEIDQAGKCTILYYILNKVELLVT